MSTKLTTLTPCLLMLCCPTLGLLANRVQAADAITTPQPTTTTDNDGNAVIIIQATKRPEDLQQVPMSVTAYTSLDIEDSTDSQLSDLWQHTANTTQMDDHRNGMLSIRGVGYGGSTQYGGEEKPTRGWSPIGFYLDGVSLETQRGMSDFNSLYDVDEVELLRGPQGTLYGRGTLGGVVNVRTKDPTWTNEIDGSLYGGSYKEYRADVAGGGPITDTLAFRVAIEKSGGDGYYDNITTGNNKTDASNDISARGKLLWKASDVLSIKATVQATSLQSSTDSWVPLALIDQHQTITDNPGFDNGKGAVSAIQADYKVSEHTLATFVFGFGVANEAVSYDADRTANDLVNVAGSDRIQDMSFEARLAHTGPDALTWLTGIYAQQERFAYSSLSTYSSQTVVGQLGPAPYYENAFAAQDYNEDARVRDMNAAVYGEATFKPDTHWEFTAGARLGYEHSSFDWDEQITNNTVFTPGPTTVPFTALQASETDHAPVFLPKADVAYHFTKDVMGYASLSEGYRPGGFNTGANSVAAATELYEPETTWNYELGLKSEVDRALTVNMAGFYIDWRNQQVPLTLGAPNYDEITVNAAHSRVFGAELEAELRPIEGLKIWGSVGLLHAQWTDYNYLGADYSGKNFPDIPPWTAAIGGFYQHKSGLFIGSTVNGQGHTYVYSEDPVSNVVSTGDLSDYIVWDAKIGYRANHWSIAALGRNLTNKAYALNSIQIPADGIFTNTPQTYVREGAPRTIGVELTANW